MYYGGSMFLGNNTEYNIRVNAVNVGFEGDLDQQKVLLRNSPTRVIQGVHRCVRFAFHKKDIYSSRTASVAASTSS